MLHNMLSKLHRTISCNPRSLGSAVSMLMLTAAVLAVSALTGPAVAHPTPSGLKARWELRFVAGDLRLYVDPNSSASYWYFTYLVENRTGQDLIWAPSLTLFTDAGELLPAGRDVPLRVVADVTKLMNNKLLEDQNRIIGDIFHGRQNAKEGLVIWPAKELDINRVDLFIAGISGETARVKNPISGEDIILRKTLQRRYLVRGEVMARRVEPLELTDQRWIMR